jgi:N-acetylglucosamine-6-sulfatase
MLAAVDEGLGQMLAALEKQNALDRTLVLIVGDNGYFYGEHGLSQERRLAYEESIRLPLLVRYPPRVNAGAEPVGLALTTDLAPTIVELAGAPVMPGIDGRSLVPLFARTPADWRKSFLIEYTTDIVFPRTLKMGYDAVRTERYKYIRYRDLRDMNELYDLLEDPFELSNLIAAPTATAARQQMEKELDRILASARSPLP